MRSYTTVTYVYRCPNCYREISHEEQVRVAKMQARTGLLIVAPADLPPEEEIKLGRDDLAVIPGVTPARTG